MIKQNESSSDRVVRVILAAIFFALGFFGLSGAWQIIFYVLSAVMIVTAATGFCALYALFGVSTKK